MWTLSHTLLALEGRRHGSALGPVYAFLSLEGDRAAFPAQVLLEDMPPLGTPDTCSYSMRGSSPCAWVSIMPRRCGWDRNNDPMHLPPTGCRAFHNQDLFQGSLAVVIGPATVQLSQGHSADQ